MELFEAIYLRQSIGKVKPDPVPRELVEKMLAAAVQAPNHHHVRPWRFVVLAGSGRERLGEVMAQSMKRRDPNVREEALAAERAKPLRAPRLIAVGVDTPHEPKVLEIENICAAAAAQAQAIQRPYPRTAVKRTNTPSRKARRSTRPAAASSVKCVITSRRPGRLRAAKRRSASDWRGPSATSDTPATRAPGRAARAIWVITRSGSGRSEEHTSELQSPTNLVCRLL